MTLRQGWRTTRGLLVASALWLGFGCASNDGDNGALYMPPGYILGGQTGSLVPDCGFAPLSAEGRSVPAGEALAVLYTGACSEPVSAEQLMLAGVGSAVRLELVPLDARGAFLVQADRSLAGGDYQLDVGANASSDVRVSDGELGPPRLGTLSLVPEGAECGEQLSFELALDDSALAYAPLSRFDLSIDGGQPQVWVDYGALPIESRADGSRGLLELPRCGAAGCLASGPHQLELTLRVAGKSAQPAPLELTFDLQCLAPTESALEPASEADSGMSCAIGSSRGPASRRAAWGALGLFIGWLCVARSRRARGLGAPPMPELQLNPQSADPVQESGALLVGPCRGCAALGINRGARHGAPPGGGQRGFRTWTRC